MFIFTSFVLSAIMATALSSPGTSSEYTYEVQGGRTCYCQCPCDGGDGDVDVRRIKRASKYDKPAENLCYCGCSCDKVDAGLVGNYIIEDVEQSDVDSVTSVPKPPTSAPAPDPTQNSVPIKNNLNQYDTLYLSISAKGNDVWAVFCNNTVVRGQMSVSGEFQSWKAVPLTGIPAGQKVIEVGASPDGTAFAVTDAYDNNIYGFDTDTATWRFYSCGAACAGTFDQVSSCGKSCAIGVNRNKDGVWGLAWGAIALNLKGNWAAFGADKSRWLVDTSGRIKRCAPTAAQIVDLNTWPTWCPNNIWEVMCQNSAVTVEAQNKDRAVMTTKMGEMFLWDGKSWNKVPFNGKVTRASVTDKWVYFLNQKGNAFFANV